MEAIVGFAVVLGLGFIGGAIGIYFTRTASRGREIINTTPATLETASHQALITRARQWWNLAAEQNQVISNILRWDRDISASLSSEDRIAAERVVQHYNEAVKGGKE